MVNGKCYRYCMMRVPAPWLLGIACYWIMFIDMTTAYYSRAMIRSLQRRRMSTDMTSRKIVSLEDLSSIFSGLNSTHSIAIHVDKERKEETVSVPGLLLLQGKSNPSLG